MLKVTLNQIKAYGPGLLGWKPLLKSLGKHHADDEPFAFEHIIDSNGMDDAIWALQCVDERASALFCVACCQDILHLMKDERSINVVKITHLWAHGEANDSELPRAYTAAEAARVEAADAAHATYDAARAAYAAAYAAAAYDASAAAYAAAYAAHAAYAPDRAIYAAAYIKQKAHLRAICNDWEEA